MNIKTCLSRMKEDIARTKLDENLFFVQTYRSFLSNIKLLETAYKNEDFEQCRKLSVANSKIALTLFKMLDDEKMIVELRSEQSKKMPDFAHMPPRKLREWCKKYDIDIDDFAKDYLYRALEKRWKRENG